MKMNKYERLIKEIKECQKNAKFIMAIRKFIKATTS